MFNLLPLISSVRVYLYVGAACLALGYVKGCADEKAHFDRFKGGVEALGKQAEEQRARRIAQQKQINKETVDALKKRQALLARDNAALLHSMRQHASRSVLPPEREPSAGDQGRGERSIYADTTCYVRGQLDAGVRGALERFLERTAPSLQRGDRALSALAACVEWAARNEALDPKSP